MEKLPTEILWMICEKLDSMSLLYLSQTNKTYLKFIEELPNFECNRLTIIDSLTESELIRILGLRVGRYTETITFRRCYTTERQLHSKLQMYPHLFPEISSNDFNCGDPNTIVPLQDIIKYIRMEVEIRSEILI
jgi:hypothetical protein